MRIYKFVDGLGAARKSRVAIIMDDNDAALAKARNDFFEADFNRFIEVAIEEREGLPEFDINGHKTGLAVERIR